jgi:hypothetical protein
LFCKPKKRVCPVNQKKNKKAGTECGREFVRHVGQASGFGIWRNFRAVSFSVFGKSVNPREVEFSLGQFGEELSLGQFGKELVEVCLRQFGKELESRKIS